jgi:hypothetical protein
MVDSAGTSPSYPVYYTSSNSSVVAILNAHTGIVGTVTHPGQAWIHATTTVYGVTLEDSLLFTVGWPLQGEIDLLKAPNGTYYANPGVDTLGLGAGTVNFATNAIYLVLFVNQTPDSLDIVFDDSLSVQPSPLNPFYFPSDTSTVGNIRPWVADVLPVQLNDYSAVRARAFPVTGTFSYHSKRFPSIQGKVVIVP